MIHSATEPGRVFLTDGISPRTLSACRSLARHKVRVTCADEHFFNLAFFSRDCHERVIYPSPQEKPQAFTEMLVDYLGKHPHTCIVPVKEESIDVVIAEREAFERVTCVPFASNDVFQICRDKALTLDLAARLGVPYPKTALPKGPGEVIEATRTLGFPMIIKPRRNCAGEGIHKVHNESELLDIYTRTHAAYPYPLVQEAIPDGEKIDVCCLFDENSRALATFVQREVRFYPLEGGPSTVQESIWRPDMVDLTLAMLQRAGWYGIAEAEFMVDPRDNTPKLMEVNPRLWGSLDLAIQCGIDFPYLLYRLARGEQIEPIHEYAVGRFCRQLIPYDILHFIKNPQRFKLEPNFFDFFNPRIGYSLISLSDPGPVLGFFLASAHYAFKPDTWRRLARTTELKESSAGAKSSLEAPQPEKAGGADPGGFGYPEVPALRAASPSPKNQSKNLPLN